MYKFGMNERKHEWTIDQPHDNRMYRKNVAMTVSFYIALLSVRLGNIGLSWHQKYKSSFRNGDDIPRQLQEIDVRQDNKTLMILIGSIRGGEKPWETLYREMLDPNMADMALVVGWDDEAHRESSLFKRAKYVMHFPEYNNWSEAMDVMAQWLNGGDKPSTKNRKTWKNIAKRQVNGLFGATREDPSGSGGVQNFARWWVSATISEMGLLEKYDRFIVTRADNYYNCETDLRHLDSNSVWVPVGQDWGGLCDRMIIGNSENFERLMDIIPSLVRDPYIWNCSDFKEEKLIPCGGDIEDAYQVRLQQNNVGKIRRFERTMFAVKTDHDRSRWGYVQGQVMDGLYFKYIDEYEDGVQFCASREDAARNSSSTSLPEIAEMSVDEYYDMFFKRHPEERFKDIHS